MSDLFKAWVYGTVRHWAGWFFSAMAAKGYVTGDQAEMTLLWLSGAAATWLWSLFEKWQADKALANIKQGGDPNGV